MTNKRLLLEVDASQIDVKQLLQKDFLELSMKAISSANPNINKSWFTRESMERSLDSFVNKPILGYFENGDFVSHNGEWAHDNETEMDYWDTLGKKGERILGIIRESDEVKIIEDDNGLSWVTFTCALWTQYSFKQVKRLIKDAKRAQRSGEPTKNISVEVDITDYDMLENGVMKINAFNLVGVTILGSRNGIKVEPGIEGAELSVVDVMGREIYSKQERTLRLAYEKLNNSIEQKEESPMDTENSVLSTSAEGTAFEAQGSPANVACAADDTQICADGCEGEPVPATECGPDSAPTEGAEDMCKNAAEGDEGNDGGNEDDGHECGHNAADDDDDDDDDGDDGHECGHNAAEEGGNEGEPQHCEANPGEPAQSEQFSSETDALYDMSWLTQRVTGFIADTQQSLDYYSGRELENKDYILSVLKRLVGRLVECQTELFDLATKITAGITADDVAAEERMSQYADFKSVFAALCEAQDSAAQIKAELDAANNTVATYEHNAFLTQAYAMIASAGLSEEDTNKLRSACEASEITSLEDLKVKVAVSAFDARTPAVETEVAAAFSAPVASPNTTAAFEAAKKTEKKKNSPWDALHEFLEK